MRSATLRRNVLANYLGKLWNATSLYVFVPLYIRFLGVEAYGLIAFYATLVGLLLVFDVGLSTAFAREVARRGTRTASLAVLLRSLEVVYFSIALAVTVLVAAASRWISQDWLGTPSELSPSVVQSCVVLMGGGAAAQIVMSLYNGGLMGSDRHAAANGFQIGCGFMRSAGVFLPLYFLADLRVFFAWQLAVTLVFALWMRRIVWQSTGSKVRPYFSVDSLFGIRNFAAGMFFIALVSAVNTQADKLALSTLMDLSELARYSVAGVLAQVPSVMTLPIAISLLPRLTRLMEEGRLEEVGEIYRRATFLIASISLIGGIGVSLGSPWIVDHWTGNSIVDDTFFLNVYVLSAGHIFLALQFMPYQLALANGHSRTSVVIGAVFMFVTPSLLLILIPEFGSIGAAIPWLLMNAVTFLLLGTVITRRYLPGEGTRWSLLSIGAPFTIILGVTAAVLYLVLRPSGFGSVFSLGELAALVAAPTTACALSYFVLFRYPKNS